MGLWMDGWMDRFVGGWMDGWGGWVGGWVGICTMDGLTNEHPYLTTNTQHRWKDE